MKVIVDTCIWSLALRRQKVVADETHIILKNLIQQSQVQMLGPIRQELLSGISSHAQFTKLKTYLSFFLDLPLLTKHYETAGDYSNICRRKGIQGSAIDFLICAAAAHDQLPILTLDKDFLSYAKYLPILLYQ